MIKKILIAVFIFCIAVFSVNAEESSGPQQQFEGFNLQGYTDGGNKSWDVNGDTADIIGDSIEITNVDANTYGEEPMNITAKTGAINKTTGNMHLEKDVVIISESGSTLKTDSLDWERNNDLVKTEDFVTITQESMVATGTGLTGHPNLKTAKLNEDVKVDVKSEPEKTFSETVTITSDGPMEIDQSNNVATFYDNVKAVTETRELESDKLTLYIDPLTKKIDKMICSGNVMITQGGSTSFSDEAIYTGADQKLILSGRPKLIMQTEGENGFDSF